MCTRLPARGSPPCDAQHTLLYYHYIHAHLQYDIEILILLHTYRPTRAVEREIFLYVSYIFVAKNVDGALSLTVTRRGRRRRAREIIIAILE
jgi:hypothetical protein